MDINKTLTGCGLKCTPQRVKVIEALEGAQVPLTAEEIYAKTEGISLSTVYRVADKLVEKGIVEKNTIRNSDKFYYELTMGKHRHYAICLGCGAMKHVDVCPVHHLNLPGFTVTGHKLEIYGYCDKCKEKDK